MSASNDAPKIKAIVVYLNKPKTGNQQEPTGRSHPKRIYTELVRQGLYKGIPEGVGISDLRQIVDSNQSHLAWVKVNNQNMIALRGIAMVSIPTLLHMLRVSVP